MHGCDHGCMIDYKFSFKLMENETKSIVPISIGQVETSTEISNLISALLIFDSKIGAIPRSEPNPFFKSKYASLSTILKAIKKPLNEAGLILKQFPVLDNCLTTVLCHKSGEFMVSTMQITPVKQDPQAIGSAITYMRRYAIGSILGLDIDEDDDGNAGSGRAEKPRLTTTNYKATVTPVGGNKTIDSPVADSVAKKIPLNKVLATISQTDDKDRLKKVEKYIKDEAEPNMFYTSIEIKDVLSKLEERRVALFTNEQFKELSKKGLKNEESNKTTN